jgi:hypothetical protein
VPKNEDLPLKIGRFCVQFAADVTLEPNANWLLAGDSNGEDELTAFLLIRARVCRYNQSSF